MLIAAFAAGPLGANCYFVGQGPGAECVIVDPGMDAVDGIADVVREQNLTPVGVLITHGHFDHMWSATPVARTYDVPVWIHPADRHLLSDPMAAISGESAAMLRAQFDLDAMPEFSEPDDVRDATDGTAIELAGLTFRVEHVPGHTPGAVMYRLDYEGPEDVSELLFTGDFLFAGSIGRTDLVGGDQDEMTTSLATKVLPLSDDIVVLPGHGPQTSVGRERSTNVFLHQVIETASEEGAS